MLRTFASRWNEEKLRRYEMKTEESEKAGSHRELNPGHLTYAVSALPLRLRQTDNYKPSQSSICIAQVGLRNVSVVHLAVCAVKTPLGVDWKILSVRREPMLSGFLSLNA